MGKTVGRTIENKCTLEEETPTTTYITRELIRFGVTDVTGGGAGAIYWGRS